MHHSHRDDCNVLQLSQHSYPSPYHSLSILTPSAVEMASVRTQHVATQNSAFSVGPAIVVLIELRRDEKGNKNGIDLE